jgi:hypothetical protein
VFDEVQGASGLEDAPHLGEGGGHVRDRAQRPSREGGVIAVVREGQGLAIQAGPFDRHAGGLQPFLRELPADVGRLDRGDPLNGLGVERDVEPRAETDLDDIPLEPFADPATQRLGALQPARDVDDPRENLLAVKSHDRQSPAGADPSATGRGNPLPPTHGRGKW